MKTGIISYPTRLLQSAVFHLVSLLLTCISIAVLVLPATVDISIRNLQLLQVFEQILLTLFFIEFILRILVRRMSYLRTPACWVDLLVVSPLLLGIILFGFEKGQSITPETVRLILIFPGINLVRGFRVLRLVEIIRFFYQNKQLSEFSGVPLHSPIIIKLFTGISTLLFASIIVGGCVIANIDQNLVDSQKRIRIEQVANHAETYGLQSTFSVFDPIVIRVEKSDLKESYELGRLPAEYVKRFYRYGHDFIQLDGVVPGGSMQISFVDLNRRQDQLELGILLSGMVILLILFLGLRLYLNRLLLNPVDRARRTIHLRLRGEEISSSGVLQEPHTEVTALINEIDQLYNK